MRAMPENPSAGELDLCPQCGRRTLLSEPSPQGRLLCLRCGIISTVLRPGHEPGA
jgi:ribosomal protein S27AE